MATKYFLKFKTEAEYKEAKKKHLKVPNVSFVVETGKAYINTESVTKENAEAGDIIAHHFNEEGSKETKIFKPEAYDKADTYWSAEAIVVVPCNHTVDGTIRAMALNCVKNISWGNNNSLKSVNHFNAVVTLKEAGNQKHELSDKGYLPTDAPGKIQNPNDDETCYGMFKPFIPSPYNNDGSKNEAYHSLNEFKENSENALSDMQGKENTNIIASAIKDIKQFPAIENCLNKGEDWYLPSCGELGYLAARFDRIKYALEQAGGIQIENMGVWSSTQFGANGAWIVLPFTGAVFASNYNKGLKNCVIPFKKY